MDSHEKAKTQEKVRSLGMCGELMDEDRQICIHPLGHDHEKEMLRQHIANGIRSYASGEAGAYSYHGDGSALEAMRRLEQEADNIAQYALDHWKGSCSN